MKYLVMLSLYVVALNIQACRGPALDNETMCNKHPACKWTENGCRTSFKQALHKVENLKGNNMPPLGMATLF
jgi:hypothetical protein